MKLHFDHEWLKHHIENDPDLPCEAGGGDFEKRWASPSWEYRNKLADWVERKAHNLCERLRFSKPHRRYI